MSDFLHGDLVDVSEDAIEATKNKALRATTSVGYFCHEDHDKIPSLKRLVAAGCARS